MPRSLIACYDNIVRFLDSIGQTYGQKGTAQVQAHPVMTRLAKSSTKEIFQSGLHEFVTAFVEDNTRLGKTICQQYLFE